MGWPKIEYTEEGMREGMQIESANIPVEDKIRLLDMLSETGLKTIVVGSFVSPKYTPQMARIDDIVKGFKPKPGVTYTALALNQRGVERAAEYSPPLTLQRRTRPALGMHLCDVFVRRNTNRSQAQEIAGWKATIAAAKERGATEAGIGMNAAWGSNFCGPFTEEQRMAVMRRQHALWNTPHVVDHQLETIRKEWPEIKNFNLHLHNARGMAMVSLYAAMRVLDETCTLTCDGTIAGFGGCPYCGMGQTTGMMPTEDIMHLWQDMGIDTGVDLDKLIDCVWELERIVGRRLYGHVSKAGPRPRGKTLFDINIPFIETEEQAKHFKLGQAAIGDNAVSPWSEPVVSGQREAVDAAIAAGEGQEGISRRISEFVEKNIDSVLAAGAAADD